MNVLLPLRVGTSSHARRDGGRAAFTLIELLVVITIIALLLAILFPAVGRALAHAKATKCTSNVRQILIARQLYPDDHNGRLIPTRPASSEDSSGVCTWRWYVCQRYGVDKDVFRCPAAPNAYSEAGRSEEFATESGDVPSNYAHISEVFGNDSRSTRANIIKTPSKQVELVEIRDYWPDMNMGSWGWAWADGYGVYGYWHWGNTTIGYADGHVEIKKLGATVTPECQWDSHLGAHDGATHAEYGAMLDMYK